MPGVHNIYVSGLSLADGTTVSDWGTFNVAQYKVTQGLHMFAFPYALSEPDCTDAFEFPGRCEWGQRSVRTQSISSLNHDTMDSRAKVVDQFFAYWLCDLLADQCAGSGLDEPLLQA